MITDKQRVELKAKIEALIALHDHLRHCVQRLDNTAAFVAGSKCNAAENELYQWIDKEL